MSRPELGLLGRAEELRRAFDRSFADAPRVDTDATYVDLLAIRVGGDGYALRLAEVAGLFVDRVVSPLPTSVPELRGLAGFRASLVPVYDLAALLGYPTADAPRWLVSMAGVVTVALAFDRFDAHVRVAHGALAVADAGARGHVREVARTSDGVRAVLHLPSVLEAINARAPDVARPKER
jgi:chemotaxis signal transduction protein